jgi:hypothetical protein
MQGALDFASTPVTATKLTEDPPFGGLWCDQPAIFLPEESSDAALAALLSEPPDDRHQ